MFPSVHHPTITNSSASSVNLRAGIIILTLLVVVSAVLCLLFRHGHHLTCFLSHRSCIQLSFNFSSDSSSHHLPSTPDITTAPGNAPTKSLVDSLPLFRFSSVTRPSNTTAATTSSSSVKADCAICLSSFASRDALRLLPLCCHAFHSRCIDPWLSSGNKTCPLCRSDVYATSSILLPPASSGPPNGSFRLEIGSVSRRHIDSIPDGRRSYSIGSFDYVVEAETEVAVVDKEDGIDNNWAIDDLNTNSSNANTGTSGGSSRSWLGEYLDTLSGMLSSRTASFRSSRSVFSGSSRRSEEANASTWDIEASRVEEEINEIFRWATGIYNQ
ncbi:hypothetical protein MLD38_021276 [Melastoma candidum]|uniref:Uncharacterized protein n=1 Tax=Melastoma candidum TaxID=119954 RepID=A0ACB9QFG7_9MYRT|nr:hypothetical protein MLD38_021276 [Melastoma candidum]